MPLPVGVPGFSNAGKVTHSVFHCLTVFLKTFLYSDLAHLQAEFIRD
jgi:hypothetical protein